MLFQLKKPPDCSGAVTSACVIIKRTLWPLHIDCHHLGAVVALDAGVVHSIGFDFADWDIFTEFVFQLRSSFVVKFIAREFLGDCFRLREIHRAS